MVKNKGQNNRISKIDAIVDLSLIALAFGSILYSLKSSMMWVLLFAILIISGINMLRHNAKMSTPLFVWYVFLIWSALGILYTNDTRYAGGFVIKLAILIISMSYVQKTDDVKLGFSVIKAVSLFAVLTVIAEVFFPVTIGNVRNMLMVDISKEEDIILQLDRLGSKYGIFSDPAVSVFFCASGFAIGVCCWMAKTRGIAVLFLGLSGWGAVLTNKRGPMLSIIIAFILIIFICSGASYKRKIRAAVFVGAIFIAAAVAYRKIPQIADWLETINSNTASGKIRADIYGKLWDNFRENIMFGGGTKSTRKLLEGYDAHNIYLAALSENGLPGLIIMVTAFAVCLNRTVKIKNWFRKTKKRELEIFTAYCIFGQLYFIFYGMTGNPMTEIYLLAFYFMCVGIPMRQYTRLSKVKGTVL